MPGVHRPRDLWTFGYGLVIAAVAAWALALHGTDERTLAWLFLAGGLARMATGYFVAVRYVLRPDTGPGPLSPTPAKRFRATGWPPSKDPEDYR